MTKKMLQLGPGLAVPADVITKALALLAVKRAGKSNAAAVLAEEMYDASLPWVAIDPKGDWWGLRLDASGTGPGLQVPIFGGLHGDMPLTPESGHLIAEIVFAENLTCILDVSEFASKAAQMRFLADFGERLFRLHGREPQPRHLFLEEADDFLPQVVRADQARCVGVWSKIVKQGGQRGLGDTLISQRSAVVNKDALTQTETLIAMRTTSPQDRKAIRDWVSHNAVAPELVDSLPSLDDGEAWVCSSHWLARLGQPAIQRTRFRQRRTFDSGATPEIGKQRRVATLGDIDLRDLGARMAAVAEKAAQDDPKALRWRITELERQLAAQGTADPAEVTALRARVAELEAREPERIEVPVLTDADRELMRIAFKDLQEISRIIATAGGAEVVHMPEKPWSLPMEGEGALRRPTPLALPDQRPVREQPVPRTAPDPGSVSIPVLSKAQRAILTVLAQYPDGRTKRQIGMLAKYSSKGGGFNNALSSLRTAGYIDRGEPVHATADGLAALGSWDPLPEGAALIDHWMGQLSKAEAAALRELLDAWPGSLTKAEIAGRAGYAADGGGFNNALSRLRTLQLIEGYGDMRADETLASALEGGRQ